MKPMIYKSRFKDNIEQIEILDEGIYHNYHYVIVSFGSHPCAYVEIPERHRYYQKNYDDIPLVCHFGLTYGRMGLLHHSRDNYRDGYWIGWDYSHYSDYFYYMDSKLVNNMDSSLKRWTTEEILAEVKDVINQLVEGDNND